MAAVRGAAARARCASRGEECRRGPRAAHDAGFRPARDYTGVALKVWRYELSERASRRTAAVQIETPRVGAWRSLVAHTLGVRVVAGSNPAAPTNL